MSAAAVEHDIRFLLACFWKRGNVALLEKRLGCDFQARPYTGEFIDILAAYFRGSLRVLREAEKPAPRGAAGCGCCGKGGEQP